MTQELSASELSPELNSLFDSIDKGMAHAFEEAQKKIIIPKIMNILGSDALTMNLSLQLMKIIETMYNHKFGSVYYKSLYELLKKSVKNKEKINLNNWEFITEEEKLLLGIKLSN